LTYRRNLNSFRRHLAINCMLNFTTKAIFRLRHTMPKDVVGYVWKSPGLDRPACPI